jgi:hypothetical protein
VFAVTENSVIRTLFEKNPLNGTHKSKLCLRLSLKAIGEHSSHDEIKDFFYVSDYAGASPLATSQGNNSLDL